MRRWLINCHLIFSGPEQSASSRYDSGMLGLAPKWVRLAPNWTNPGFFRSDFSTFGSIWKSPAFVPFRANMTNFGAKHTIPDITLHLFKTSTEVSDKAKNYSRLARNGTDLKFLKPKYTNKMISQSPILLFVENLAQFWVQSGKHVTKWQSQR